MSTFKKAKVVMLPTNETKGDFSKERIYPCLLKYSWMFDENETGKLIYSDSNIRTPTQLQHLYIISDDEIKEGDWYYCKRLNKIFQAIKGITYNIEGNEHKIIATTDESLNLPQPSKQFIQKYIEEYNKGNVITDVLVEYENVYIDAFGTKIVQHKKDSNSYLKQCTFINSILKVNPKDNTITIKKTKENYTKEEVIRLLERYISFLWKEIGIHYPISLGKDAKDKFINSEL